MNFLPSPSARVASKVQPGLVCGNRRDHQPASLEAGTQEGQKASQIDNLQANQSSKLKMIQCQAPFSFLSDYDGKRILEAM